MTKIYFLPRQVNSVQAIKWDKENKLKTKFHSNEPPQVNSYLEKKYAKRLKFKHRSFNYSISFLI